MQVQSQFIEMFGNTTPTKKISDICNVRGGSTPTRTMKEYWEDGTVSWFTVEDIYEQGRYISDTKQHITELATKKCFVYPIDTVLICCTASVGEYAITKKEMASNQQFNGMIIKDKNKVHPEFLLYVASTLKDDLLRKAGKTTINFVSRSKLEEIEIPVPAIEEQKRFISIFQQSDKSKFVGFKSQFIEMFGELKTTQIGNYIMDSFPGEWGKEDKNGTGIKVIRTTNFTNSGKLDLSEVVTRSIEERKVQKKQIQKYDTILEKSGGTADKPVGRVVLFEENEQYLCNNFTQVLRFKDINPQFAFYALFYFYQTNKTAIRSMGSRTTGIQNLNMSKYLEIGIPDADKIGQRQFVSIAEQADKSKLIELSNKCYHKIYSIPTIQKKLLENGSPKATIETDESRSYFLIDIPCRKDFIQDDSILRQIDIHRVTINLMTKCPRYVQDMSKIEVEHLSVCILKSRTAVSAQIMLEGVDKVSYKQKRRKYLDKLLEMGVLLMTIPEKPTSRNQQYILSEYGKGLLE